jgi:hypothetical protein
MATAQGQFHFNLDSVVENVNREVRVDGAAYVVTYGYRPSRVVSIPTTDPPGTPHYNARVTVRRLDANGPTQIGEPMDGTYVEGGCFEDRPEDYVRLALESAKRKGNGLIRPFDENPAAKGIINGIVIGAVTHTNTIPGLTSSLVYPTTTNFIAPELDLAIKGIREALDRLERCLRAAKGGR